MTFFNRMRFVFLFFILFGLWTTWENNKYKSLLRLNSMLAIVLTISNFTLQIYLKNLYDFISLSNIVANSLFIFMVFSQLVIVVESIWHNHTQVELINKFSNVDILFASKLHSTVSYREEKFKVFMLMLILVSLEIIVEVFNSTFLLLFSSHNYNLMFPYEYPNIMSYLRSIQIICFVYLTQRRLKMINEELTNIQKPMMNVRSTLSIFERIFILKHIYGELYDIKELIEMLFGWSLLTNIVSQFCSFTSNCYWTYKSLSNMMHFITNLCAMAASSTVLIALGFHCSSCSHQVCDHVYYYIDH